MAQERYGFFNSTAGDERSYDSADMAAALRALAASGVAAADTCLQVTAEGSTMRTLVGYGSAMIQGHFYQLKDDGGGAQAFAHATEALVNRIDRIILRLDLTARTVSLVKLIGIAASTPAAPELTRGEESWELSLARVLIRAAAQEILASDITDDRENEAVCGLIAPEALRLSAVRQMIDGAVEAATDDVVRFTGQTLETAQKEQARTNINAQEKIAASGLLKGSGTAVSAAAAGTDYALPVTEVSATLTAAGWSGSAAPFTQSVTITGMTANKKAIVGLPHSATGAQYAAALAALLRVTSQETDAITVTAEGDKPAIDLPILTEIVG